MIKEDTFRHKYNKKIVVTFNGDWYKKYDTVRLSFSSFMECYVLFYECDNESNENLRVYENTYDQEDFLTEILKESIENEYIDLAKYFNEDETDFRE